MVERRRGGNGGYFEAHCTSTDVLCGIVLIGSEKGFSSGILGDGGIMQYPRHFGGILENEKIHGLVYGMVAKESSLEFESIESNARYYPKIMDSVLVEA